MRAMRPGLARWSTPLIPHMSPAAIGCSMVRPRVPLGGEPFADRLQRRIGAAEPRRRRHGDGGAIGYQAMRLQRRRRFLAFQVLLLHDPAPVGGSGERVRLFISLQTARTTGGEREAKPMSKELGPRHHRLPRMSPRPFRRSPWSGRWYSTKRAPA